MTAAPRPVLSYCRGFGLDVTQVRWCGRCHVVAPAVDYVRVWRRWGDEVLRQRPQFADAIVDGLPDGRGRELLIEAAHELVHQAQRWVDQLQPRPRLEVIEGQARSA